MVLATRGRKSRIRRLADSQELDTGILLVIMFNCVIMAFPPNKLKNATSPTDFFCLADFILNFIFLRVRDQSSMLPGWPTLRTRGTSWTLSSSCRGHCP